MQAHKLLIQIKKVHLLNKNGKKDSFLLFFSPFWEKKFAGLESSLTFAPEQQEQSQLLPNPPRWETKQG